MRTIIVSDSPELAHYLPADIHIISAVDYLSDHEYANGTRYRVINLCQSYHYQMNGYYVSLLAEARHHKVIPSVLTIQDIYTRQLSTIISEAIDEDIQKSLQPLKSEEFILSIYFGKNIAKRYENISKKLHSLFPLPLFRVYFSFNDRWKIEKIKPIAIKDISPSHLNFFVESAKEYLGKKRFYNYRHKSKFYDLAILHNPLEATPPSNKKALDKFMHAGDALGINVELIERPALKNLAEYDGLLIRETTSVNHHTYLFARKASSERMVVIDDPMSILRCGNKVYLAELMQKHAIPTPRTWILNKFNWQQTYSELTFPCVLKLPDSAFSKGVVKVKDHDELEDQLKQFFKHSELIIAQEFFYTDFDWRICIIDNKPLFAVQYFMADGHWQIYNWQSKKNEDETGDFRCVPINEVPAVVMKTAQKATRLIGDSLYGVDLKQQGDKAYVIEVNDNPTVDHGVEDTILGDSLYRSIMDVFLTRLRRRHGYE